MSTQQSYSTKEAAELLGVHRNTIRSMVQDGRLQAFKTKGDTGHLRFSKETIDRFIEEQDLSRVSPRLISETHFLYANKAYDVKRIEDVLDAEHDIMLFRHLLDMMAPSRVFGSQLQLADKEEYAELMRGKAHKWVVGGISTMDMSKANKMKSGLLANKLSIGLGSIDLGGYRKPLTATVVFHGEKADIVLDGTLQQHIPSLDKGIIMMEKDVAESFYIKFSDVSIDQYANELDADQSQLFKSILESVFDSEFDEENPEDTE